MAPIKFDTHKKTVNSVNEIKHWTKGAWSWGQWDHLHHTTIKLVIERPRITMKRVS